VDSGLTFIQYLLVVASEFSRLYHTDQFLLQ
jgi:hypothetical protein